MKMGGGGAKKNILICRGGVIIKFLLFKGGAFNFKNLGKKKFPSPLP
jgi:hypothetical protein